MVLQTIGVLVLVHVDMYVKILRDALMYQNGCFLHIVERGGGGQTHM